MAERQLSRGLLSQLPPGWRAAAILTLAATLIGVLYFLDSEGVEAAWRDQPLELVERILNIIIASGTVWAVLFEGDAILAAFARAFASRFAITFAFIAEALKRAGMNAASIRSILADMLARMPPGAAAAAKAQFDDAVDEASPTEPTSQTASPPPPARAEQPAAAPPSPSEPAKSSRRRGLALVAAICVAALVVAFCVGRSPAPPTTLNAGGPADDEVVETSERWIIARGSVSQTLTECLGQQSWAEQERSVATANGIPCRENARGLHCTVRDAQPLQLPADMTCGANVEVYPSRDAAQRAVGATPSAEAENAQHSEN